MMKHLVYLALAAGALAMTGCDDVAAPKPAAPLAAAPAAPAPTPATPAAEYSCGDGYIFDSDQLPGPEGAVVNDVFYWGSSTSGAARCFSDTRNNSIVGRVESNTGDVATGATVMSVTLSGELRWYLILEFSDGTYCSAATAGDGRATCFATVERDATGFRVDDLPAVPLPVPEGAPERPVVDPPGGPGPGGGDVGGGHTGAPEPAPKPEKRKFKNARVAYIADPDQSRGGVDRLRFVTRYGLDDHDDLPDERRLYLILKLNVPRDGYITSHNCIVATTGNGRVTCVAPLKFWWDHSHCSDGECNGDGDGHMRFTYNATGRTAPHPSVDHFPTSTSPQSSDGDNAIGVTAYLIYSDVQNNPRHYGRETFYVPPGWPSSPSTDRWYFILAFSDLHPHRPFDLDLDPNGVNDHTFCIAATKGDGIVTCHEMVKGVSTKYANGYIDQWEVPYVP